MDEAADEGTAEQTPGDEALRAAIEEAAEAVFAILPEAGAVERASLDPVRARLDTAAAAAAAAERTEDVDMALAVLFARAASLAIAAGDRDTGRDWLTAASRFAQDDDQRAEIEAALEQPERFRALAHGRALFARANRNAAQASGGIMQQAGLRTARRDERAARKIWKELAKGADRIAKSAVVELRAPRPLNGHMPSLWSYNGFGLRFAGHRDPWEDGTYATTQCITALFIPLFPLKAYRVASDGEGWVVLAREPLSSFARAMRYALLGGIVALIAGVWIHGHVNDPARLARKQFDRVLASASGAAPEAALRQLDAALAGPDLHLAGRARVQRAGADIIRITAGMAPEPFKREDVDHGSRLVQRYRELPPAAQGGAARDAAAAAIEGWTKALGTGADTAEARLALLKLGAAIADAKRSGMFQTQIAATRLAVADARAADHPIDALALLVEQPSSDAVARANKIVARLVESPSTLIEAGADLDRWMAALSAEDPLRKAATSQRELALAGRKEAEAEGVTPAQLAAMAKARPWDQYVQLRLARAEIDAGKLEAAAARLDGLGAKGLLVREGRLLLAQLASALGQLERADALLTGLLAGRLERYLAASGELQAAFKRASARVEADLRAGHVPFELQQKLQGATDDAARAAFGEYMQDQVGQDPAVQKAREAYEAVVDIVPVSLAAGSVKLRRAQGLSGATRDAMLREAERTFLAIRTEAEGQPDFRLGLGEIYARLGKTKESEAELAAVLAMNQPELSLRVAVVYRNLGSVGRAREVATAVHDGKPSPDVGYAAAELLGVIESGTDDEASERWYRKANQSEQHIRAALLGLEARRALRQGKLAECGPKFAAVARMHLEGASPNYNNAAVAHMQRFRCSGDLAALSDAEAALEKAHRASPENPIIIGNLAGTLNANSQLRVLGKRIDLQGARLDGTAAEAILGAMIEGPERDAMLADLAADRGAQRAAELLGQYEVLAPNSPAPYQVSFGRAYFRRDEAAALAVVERARRARKIDTGETVQAREEHARGARDDRQIEAYTTALQRYADLLARRPTGKVRAAILLLDATNRSALGTLKGDRALLARARAEALEAMKLWPTLDAMWIVTGGLVDEAGFQADAPAWGTLRRTYTPAGALTKLAAEGSPIAAAIRGSKPWAEVAAHLRADRSRPSLDALRLARLLGDAELEARARAVLDDKLAHAGRQLAALLDPGDPGAAADLAAFDRR
ncbi:MAG TPA: hypothetical protein VK932_08660 [Kofleriaceae bacterium]|nr:hypothetical protein [Kofleriaceae bacterium]